MPDDDTKGTPSLEPPSFFRRKKRKKERSRSAPSTPAEDRRSAPQQRDADIRPEVEPVPPPRAEETPTTILDVDQPTFVQAGNRPPGPPPPPPLFADEAPLRAVPSAPPVVSSPPSPPAPPRVPRGPRLPGWVAAVVTGLIVGALIVGGTSGAMRLCTEVRGTESCGNAGFPLLMVILIVAVLLGALMLRAMKVAEPGSTSFLAVGLLSVVALLFLIDQLLEWWMAIVIPVVSIFTYLLSQWVTSSFVEPPTEDADEAAPELHDIR